MACSSAGSSGPTSPLPVEGGFSGRTYALVIGNQSYRDLISLKTALRDAYAVADVLRDAYGYTVKVLDDATREEIFAALAELSAQTTEVDSVLVYYAGHGFLDSKTDTGYWLPVDARKLNRAQWISNYEITDFFRGMAALHVLVVADSCYSGSLLRADLHEQDPRALRTLATRRSRVVITSGGTEPVADGGGGNHSVFAKYFLHSLRANDGVLDAASLFTELRGLVAANSDQVPEYGYIAKAGHEGGDFLFLRPRPGAPRQGVPAPVLTAAVASSAPPIQSELTLARPASSYSNARSLYEQAAVMPEGTGRTLKWRDAAAAYEAALSVAPDSNEAPEALMNAAHSYRQGGDIDRAIDTYSSFISRYGSELTLSRLKNGDPEAKPPIGPDRRKYEDRVRRVQTALESTAVLYSFSFDFVRAARTYEEIGNTSELEDSVQRRAARRALELYVSLEDPSGGKRMRQLLIKLEAPPEEVAEADYHIAKTELDRWDPNAPDEGANAAARSAVQQAMEEYHRANKNKDVALPYLVQAAYWSARTRRAAAASDTAAWWKSTVGAYARLKVSARWQKWRSTSARPREASMAAESAFALIDDALREKFDYDSGFHRYRGTPKEVLQQFDVSLREAGKWSDELQQVIDGYASPEWAAVAAARQGSLWDSVRTGLYNARAPALLLYDTETEQLLKRAENSDDPGLLGEADATRVRVHQSWRHTRDEALARADQRVIERYGTALVLAKRANASHPWLDVTRRRLLFFTEVIGDDTVMRYAARVKDLNYTPGMFQRMRPGHLASTPHVGLPPPLPVRRQ